MALAKPALAAETAHTPSQTAGERAFLMGLMYGFQFGKGPNDPKGQRYVLPHAFDPREPNVAGNVAETTIAALGLKVDQSFGYWFDFGDDWWHQINVVAIDDQGSKGKYPKGLKRVGKSPPQYADDEE